MTLNRLSKLFMVLVAVGLVALTSAIAAPASATAPDCKLSPSAVHFRAEIPSVFIQPVVPCDVDDLLDASVPPMGPHTFRDLIPSEFIQPVVPPTVNTPNPAALSVGTAIYNQQAGSGIADNRVATLDYSRMTGTYLPIKGGEVSDRTIDYSRMTGTYLPMQGF